MTYRPEFFLTEQSDCRTGGHLMRHADCMPPLDGIRRSDRLSTAVRQTERPPSVAVVFGRSCVVPAGDERIYHAGGAIYW